MRKLTACLLPGLVLAVASARADTLRLDAAKAVELALSNPKVVELTRAKIEDAAAGKSVACGSFLPQVSAAATYTRLAQAGEFTMYAARESVFGVPVFDPQGNHIGQTAPIPVAVGLDTFHLKLGSENNYGVTGTVQQTLFTWGKLINAYRIAGLNLEMTIEGVRQTRSQLRVDATSAFYQALLARRTVDVMNDALRQLKGHVGQVQSLYDNGMAAKLDLTKATLGLQQMEAQVSQIENGAGLATAALLNTLGIEPGTPVSFAEDLAPDSMAVGLDSAQAQALRDRPELKQLRDAVKMSELGIAIARTANLPNAFAQVNASYKNPVGFNAEWGADWNATAGISMPLFTGMSNLSKLRQSQAKYRQARVGLAMAEDGIRLEVEALHNTLKQEQKNIEYQSQNVSLAEDALEMAETGYKNGLVTNLEYLDTQLALTRSRLSHLSSLANHRIAGARLRRAMGIAEEE